MKWIKLGRIFNPDRDFDWLMSHASVPLAECLVENQNLYRIYFSGRDKLNRSQTGFIDIDIERPHRIRYITKRPVLSIGSPGSFDDSGAMASWIVNHDQKKYLYYAGWNLGVTVPFRNAVGLAISRDEGRSFQKWSEGPIIDRGIYDPYFVGASCVLKEADLWKKWYLSCIKWDFESGKPKHRYHIKYASSHDGIQWERTGLVCIDFQSEQEYAISRPCVIKEQGLYKMWYSYRGESYRIGYAESADGLQWERKDDLVGITVSESGWDSEMIEYPFVFDHSGNRYMLYNGNGYGRTGIGLAQLVED